MTNLITEARELCESATPGPWGVNQLDDCFIEPRICEIPANGCYDYKMVEANSMFIARTRTLIPELCDALEKAERGGCEFCKDNYEHRFKIMFRKGTDWHYEAKYCPMCGRNLHED